MNGHTQITFAEYHGLSDADKMTARVKALENVVQASDIVVLTRTNASKMIGAPAPTSQLKATAVKRAAASAGRRPTTAKRTTVAKLAKQ